MIGDQIQSERIQKEHLQPSAVEPDETVRCKTAPNKLATHVAMRMAVGTTHGKVHGTRKGATRYLTRPKADRSAAWRPSTMVVRRKRIREEETRDVVAQAVSADGQATSEGGGDNRSKHAILHDFCMGLPYGTIFLVGGVAAVPFVGTKGLVFALCGGLVLLLSILSLKQWRSRKSSKWCTLAGSCAAAVALWRSWSYIQAPYTMYTAIPAFASLLSGLMSLFLLYNVLAGGNPPKNQD